MHTDLAELLSGSAVRAARSLIGWRLCCGDKTWLIAETEAYASAMDRACHAHRGRTARTELLYARPGTLYVYLCYGMHWLLNVVCQPEGRPAAVLIRGLLHPAIDPRQSNGPGKITRILGLHGGHHGMHLDDPDCPISLLPPEKMKIPRSSGPRVGVAYAGPLWANKPWRWWISSYPALANPLDSQRQPAHRSRRDL